MDGCLSALWHWLSSEVMKSSLLISLLSSLDDDISVISGAILLLVEKLSSEYIDWVFPKLSQVNSCKIGNSYVLSDGSSLLVWSLGMKIVSSPWYVLRDNNEEKSSKGACFELMLKTLSILVLQLLTLSICLSADSECCAGMLSVFPVALWRVWTLPARYPWCCSWNHEMVFV